VGDAIDSDVRTMTRLVFMARLVPRGMSLQPIMDEVREMLHREVDYASELKATHEFHERLKDDPRFAVPRVFPEYSTNQVLTTSYESGERIQSDAVQGLSQARRNRLSQGALELFLREFFRWSMVQTDPHFGNYRVRIGEKADQDKLVLLDFGATRWFSADFVSNYGDVVRGAFNHDAEAVVDAAERLNLMSRAYPQTILDAFVKVCFLIVEPFTKPEGEYAPPEELVKNNGAYLWGDSDLPNRVTRTIARAALSRYFRIPPREIVFLHRRMGGVFMLLAALGAEIKSNALLREYLRAEPIRRAAPD
jgi:predicted unusual protein kinase regulating ubiquinone biosynthesis (AarF/ABC1/UbiB family)